MTTRAHRLWIVALGVGLAAEASAGCGGSPPPAPAAVEAKEATSGSAEGEACVEAASAPREAKPDEPADIAVSQILVRHAELEQPRGATRTRQEACLRALEARSAFEKSGDWEATVATYSDAADVMKGSLGRVSRDQLDKAFADAAFLLGPNEVSYVVETPRGFHIIFRTE